MPSRAPRRCCSRRRWLPASVAALALTACHAPGAADAAAFPHRGISHRYGETFVQTRAYYSVPILQKSFFWDGNGEDDAAGLGAHVAHFVDDDIAIGAGLNFGNWFQSGRDAHSVEAEGLLRAYPVHDWPLFVDLHGGYQQADHPVPTGGTDWNFTFGFGGGVDVPVADDCSLILGCTYHHTSNALGRMNDRNPSQNEARFFIGFAWTL
jgi:hypothetical protein